MRRVFSLFLLSAPLSGCVGGTLSDTRDFEMFPLRAATEKEGRSLKRCLQAASRAQAAHRKRTGLFARKVRELPLDDDCQGMLLAQHGTKTGYELRAEIRENDTTVRWSVNEQGVIEEHLDEASDGELEL